MQSINNAVLDTSLYPNKKTHSDCTALLAFAQRAPRRSAMF